MTQNIPLTISRIGHSRGRPVAQGLGKCGAITRHSASELRRRLAANGRRTVVENYSIQAVRQKYLAILDNVVGQVRTSDCMSVASCSDR
jgi:hypothetical protein